MRGLNKQIELLRREVNEKSHELHNIEHLIGLKVSEDVTSINSGSSRIMLDN